MEEIILSLSVDFVVDANFFISSFSKYPARLATLREICEAHNYNLFTSDFILKELRRYVQSEVRKHVEIVKVSRNEIKELLKDPIDKKSLPQIPDLSLIVTAKKVGEAVIVSSDFKLLETAKQFGVKGLMGSAWLLELYEKTRGSMLRRVLKIMRDDVWADEVRYSIKRQELFDPVKRIKLIEEQARKVIEEQVKVGDTYQKIEEHVKLRRKSREKEKLLEKEAEPFLGLVQQIREYFPKFLEELKEERYSELINEIDQYLKEFEYHLLLLSLTISKDAHLFACRQTSIDYLLLNYFSALAYLYRAGSGDIYQAADRIEEANKSLLFNPNVSNRVKTMIHFLRILLLILTESYEKAEFYFSLFSRKCEEWEIKDQIEANDGLFTALTALRGYERLPDLKNSRLVIDFLVDLASSFFTERKHENVKKILEYALKLAENEDLLTPDLGVIILQKLYMSLFAENYRFMGEYSERLKQILYLYKKKGWTTEKLEPFQKKMDAKTLKKKGVIRTKPTPINDAHPALRSWTDILKRQDIKDKETVLVVRNWDLGGNIKLQVPPKNLPQDADIGDQIKIISGDIIVKKTLKKEREKEHVDLKIEFDKTEDVQLVYRGGQGFRCIAVKALKISS